MSAEAWLWVLGLVALYVVSTVIVLAMCAAGKREDRERARAFRQYRKQVQLSRTVFVPTTEYRKWRVRKQGGFWQVWRPGEVRSIVKFATFAELQMWQPDCARFLRGHCNCRFECAR